MSLQGFSGAAGIKYGLNLRGVKKPVAPGRGLFCAAQEDDDEGDAEEDRAQSDAARANIQIARQQAQQRESQKVGLAAVASACGTDSNSAPQVHELYASALAEDATVFDYDGVYDQMKASTQKQPVRGGWETASTLSVFLTHLPRTLPRLLRLPRPRRRRQSTSASC